MRRGVALAALLLVAGCAARPDAKSPIAEFLAFGDSGYHYDYLEFDDEPGPKTLEAFVEAERLDWLEDKRPPAEFRPPPAYRVPETGSFIAASGQAAVATAMRRFCEGPPACEFAVMLGDNIYPEGATAGADGRDDAERFRKIFHEPYAPLAAICRRIPDLRGPRQPRLENLARGRDGAGALPHRDPAVLHGRHPLSRGADRRPA